MFNFDDEMPEVRLGVADDNVKRIAALEPVMRELENCPRGQKMAFWYEVASKLAATYTPASGTEALSVKRLQAIYAQWKRVGWQALTLNYGKQGEEKLKPAFVQFWKSLVLQFGVKRGVRQAHHELRRRYLRWRAGDAASAIPGYDRCPEWDPATNLPSGWSYPNLNRKCYLPTKAETVAAKGGALAAREFKAPVCVKRAAEPGMVYQFDDMWHDHYASVPGFAQPVRPLEFACIDESSACRVLFGVRPRLPRKDGTNEQLQGHEMALLLATLLTTVGFHRDGCTLKVENGTATVDAEQEAVLHRISGGRIRVERGAMLSGGAFDGGFSGQARGNFKHKAALESQHSLIHNAASIMPAYSGNNRRVPEDTQGLLKKREQLYKKAEKFLPQELLDTISAGECGWDDYNAQYCAIVERVNRRTEHNLRDWEGREVAEYRTDTADEFRPVTAGTNREVVSLVCGDPLLFRRRKMSPREVFERGRSALIFVDYREAALLCRKWWKACRVRENKTIDFKDDYGVYHQFYARIRNATSVTDLLPGTEVFVFLNPMWGDAHGLLIFDAQARLIGESTDEIERLNANDKSKIERACGIAEGSFRDAVRSVNAFAKPRRDARRKAIVQLDERCSEADAFFTAIEEANQKAREKVLVESDDDFDGIKRVLPVAQNAAPLPDDDDDLLF